MSLERQFGIHAVPGVCRLDHDHPLDSASSQGADSGRGQIRGGIDCVL